MHISSLFLPRTTQLLSSSFSSVSLSSSARRSRLRRLTRGIPNVGHRRVDDQLRLPHGLRVRRRVRAETGHSHQRQHHRLANRGDFQRRLIFRTGGE